MKDENLEKKNGNVIGGIIFIVTIIVAFGYLAFSELDLDIKWRKKVDFLASALVKTWGEDVTKINDSTYHMNLADGMCATFQKSYDTLKVDAVGISWMEADLSKDDTIRIYGVNNDGEDYMGQKYRNLYFYINYHDYFEDNVNFIKFQAGKQYGPKNRDTASYVNI